MKAALERLCAFALSAALVCSFTPAAAFADTDTGGTGTGTEAGNTDTGNTDTVDSGSGDSGSGDSGSGDGGGTVVPVEPGPVVTEKVYTKPVFVGKAKVTKNGSKIRKITIPKVRFTINTVNAQTKKVVSSKKSGVYGYKVEVNIPNKGWKKAKETSSGKYYSYDAGSSAYIQAIRVSYTDNGLKGRLKQAGKKLYYQTTVQSFGTMGWAKMGQKAGTTGNGCAMTKITLKLAKSKPSSSAKVYISAPSVKYNVRYKGKSSWTGSKKDGAACGKQNWKTSISGLSVKLSSASFSGGIKYSVRTGKKEKASAWSAWASNGSKTKISKKSKVQAIKIKLTGDMAKKYNVYYRVYAADHHWMGWAKNGKKTGTKNLNYPIGAVQVKLVAKGLSAPGSTKGIYTSKVPAKGGAEITMLRRAQKFSSGTKYLILVNRAQHRVGIFTGSKGNWKLLKFWSCVTGKSSTPTITGTFRTSGGKLSALPHWPNAQICTHITGGYYFHTILSGNWELGQSLSHGCIRMARSSAKWIQSHINGGTTVNIYN